jgi:hypothetical protein
MISEALTRAVSLKTRRERGFELLMDIVRIWVGLKTRRERSFELLTLLLFSLRHYFVMVCARSKN